MMKSPFDSEYSGEAIVEYGDSDFMILKPGRYVKCAVTGDQIPIQDLRYWSADLQEAYKDGYVSARRYQDILEEPGR